MQHRGGAFVLSRAGGIGAALLLAAAPVRAGTPPPRAWHAADGAVITGSYAGVAGAMVSIRRGNGARAAVWYGKLSAEDQQYVRATASSSEWAELAAAFERPLGPEPTAEKRRREDALKRLRALRDAGRLTPEEYNAALSDLAAP